MSLRRHTTISLEWIIDFFVKTYSGIQGLFQICHVLVLLYTGYMSYLPTLRGMDDAYRGISWNSDISKGKRWNTRDSPIIGKQHGQIIEVEQHGGESRLYQPRSSSPHVNHLLHLLHLPPAYMTPPPGGRHHVHLQRMQNISAAPLCTPEREDFLISCFMFHLGWCWLDSFQ